MSKVRRKWEVFALDDHATEIHVVPLDDLIQHDNSEDCICGPKPELILRDCCDSWMYSHEALDGRE